MIQNVTRIVDAQIPAVLLYGFISRHVELSTSSPAKKTLSSKP